MKNALRVHMSAIETMGIKSSRMPLSQSQLWIVRGMENKGAKPAKNGLLFGAELAAGLVVVRHRAVHAGALALVGHG